MAKPYALLFRHERCEIEFDLVWIGVLRECESLREAHDVGVDADGLLPESVAKQDIGCFSSYAGKSKKVVQLVGHFAIEALDDLAAAVMNRASFIPIEIDFADLLFQLRHRLAGIVFRRSVFLEKNSSYSVDEIVPGLCREDQGDQQLQWVSKIQVELGVRMGLFQSLNDLLNLHFFSSA